MTTNETPDLSDLTATVKTLRDAASSIRAQAEPGPVLLGLATWLEAEATVIRELVPFTTVMSAFVHDGSGVAGSIALGVDAAAGLAVRISTVDQAVAVARTVLGVQA